MAIDGTLKVDTADMINAATEFEGIGTQTNNLTQQMLQLVRGTSSYYQGEDATLYTNKFNSLEASMQKMFRMIKEESDDLIQMARVLDEGRNATVDATSGLTTPPMA